MDLDRVDGNPRLSRNSSERELMSPSPTEVDKTSGEKRLWPDGDGSSAPKCIDVLLGKAEVLARPSEYSCANGICSCG